MVSGAGIELKARKASSASGSMAASKPGARRRALSSEAKASAPPASAWNSGLMPKRSRASTSRRSAASHSARANMPRRRSTKRGPHSR